MDRLSAKELYYKVLSRVDGFFSKLLFGIRSWFFDEEYYSIDSSTFNKLLERWRNILKNLHYVADKWDCDDYAEYFASVMKLWSKTNGCGMALGILCEGDTCGGHAWNICLVGNEVIEVEPQVGQLVTELEKTYNIKYKLKAVLW